MLIDFLELGVNHSKAFSKHAEPLLLEAIYHFLELLLPLLHLLKLFESLAVVRVLRLVLENNIKIAAFHLAQLGRLVRYHA